MALDKSTQMVITSGGTTFTFPWMSNFEKSYERNVKTYTKQSGGEVDVVLYNRLVITGSTKCMYDVLEKFLALRNQSSFTVEITTAGSTAETATMRFTSFSYSIVKESADLIDSTSPRPLSQKGIYNVSFTLREF